MKTIDLLTAQATLRMDVSTAATSVEIEFDGLLRAPPVGIYRIDQLEPVLQLGRTYYHKESVEMKPVVDINSVNKSVYDDKGILVIPMAMMLNQDKFLSNYPLLPYQGCHIAKAFINKTMHEFGLPYRRSQRPPESWFYSYFSGMVDADIVARISDCCTELSHQLSAFIDSYEWNIFFVKMKGTVVTVERCMDWRAYEWEIKHGESFKNGKYS